MARATMTFLLVMSATSMTSATSVMGDDALGCVRVRYAGAGVTIQAQDGRSEPATLNVPFLPGDRLLTGAKARAELQVADGTLLRLDKRSQLDYLQQAVEPGSPDRLELALEPGGTAFVLAPSPGARYAIETAHGRIELGEPAAFRIDATRDGTLVSVFAGAAVMIAGGEALRLERGQAATAAFGGAPARLNTQPNADAFARWSAARGGPSRPAAPEDTGLPEMLWPYAEELERAGEWILDPGTERSVWRPDVFTGWQPFLDGRWYWTADAWFWVDDEPWGWVTSHYGQWRYASDLGWHWSPGEVFAPAWVDWEQDGEYVGWMPWYDESLIDVDIDINPWVFTHRRDFRSHALHRCRVDRPRPVRQRAHNGQGQGGHAVPRVPGPGGETPPPPAPDPSNPPSSGVSSGVTIRSILERMGQVVKEGGRPPEGQRSNTEGRAAREPMERRLREESEREQRAKDEAQQRSAREQIEREQREKQARQAQERAEQVRRESEERATSQREAQARVEREQRQRDEAQQRSAREQIERERRENEDRQARERAASQREAQARREAEEQAKSQREAQARAEREQREKDEAQQRARVIDAVRR